jgi:hypothetical protein
LQDIIDATWAWVRYRVEQIQPRAVTQIDRCYEKYREKSIQEFAEEEGLSVSKVQDPRGTDLSVVIASRLAAEGDEFSLDGLMRTLTSLFDKVGVTINQAQ